MHRAVPTPVIDAEIFEAFLAWIGSITDLSLAGATPDLPVADALDSLGLTLLLLDMEHHGVPTPDDPLAAWVTLADLYAYCGAWPSTCPSVHEVLDQASTRVTTVPVLAEHVPLLHEVIGAARAARRGGRGRGSISLADLEGRFGGRALLDELVIDREDGEVLGVVRVVDYDERKGHAQLVALSAGGWRSTRFVEGIGLVADRAFAIWPLRKLYVVVPAGTDVLLTPRRHLLVDEGCLAEHESFAGDEQDGRVYAMHRSRLEGWRYSTTGAAPPA